MQTAYVTHALQGRLRLKIPAKRGDGFYFASLESDLSKCPGVESVTINPRAASALIKFWGGGGMAVLNQYARKHKLFTIKPDKNAELKTLNQFVYTQVKQVDEVITLLTRGHLDMQSIFFLLFLGLGLQQLWRGQIMQPAIPMLWRALEILQDLES